MAPLQSHILSLQYHVLLFSAGLAVALSALWWTVRHREKHATFEFGIFLGAIILWGGAQLVEVLGGPGVATTASFAIEALRGVMAASWFYFTVTYAGYGEAVSSKTSRVATGIGLLYLLVFTAFPPVATAVTFDVIVTSTPFVTVAFEGATPFHNLAKLIGYLFTGGGTLVLTYRLLVTEYTRAWQTTLFLLAAVGVIVFDATLSGLSPLDGVDYSVIGTSLVSVIFILALFRGDLFSFRPVARDHVFQRMDSGVVVLNPDHKILDFNEPAARILDGDLAIGRDAREVLPDPIADDERVRSLRAGEATVELSSRSPPEQFDLSVSTLSSPGDRNGIVLSLRNVTDREAREHDLRLYRRAVDAAGDAIFICDAEGIIEYVNPAFEAISGYSSSEAIGQTPNILNSGETDDDHVEELWSTILAGDVWEDEIINQRRDGTLYHVHETIAPILDDDSEVTAFVAIQTDITDRKERQQHLQVLDRTLRHNVRNDINVIRGWAEAIHAQAAGEFERGADRIIQQSDQLLETANKEKLITEILAQRPVKTDVNIAAVIRDTVSGFTSTTPEADISFCGPDSLDVQAIPKVDLLLEELVRNSIDHSDQEAPDVRVTLEREAGHARIRVADDGPRISEMDRDILNDGGEIDELYHGSGLGLWLVYWIVKRSNGRVSYRENDPRGNIIEFTLPLSES